MKIFIAKIQKFLPVILIFIMGICFLYLRYYNIEREFKFGWDQGRDAWTIRGILQGHQTLDGPRTGVGNFHLGPLYFYLVAPFFFFTNLDPIGTIYFNILANLINFLTLFLVIKKMVSTKAALLSLFIFTFSSYAISHGQIPWNVSLVPAISAIFMLTLYKIAKGKYQLTPLAIGLVGLFFHFHFTAVFLPIPLFFTFLISPNKLKIIKLGLLSIPVLILFFLPTFLSQATQYGKDVYAFRDFMKYYFVGIHPRFFLYRFPDSLIQFDAILLIEWLKKLKYIIFAIFLITSFFDKNRRTMGLITFFMFLSMILGFGIYGGPVSDYYYIVTMPATILVLTYLQLKFVSKFKLVGAIIITLFGVYWFSQNTANFWVKNQREGLAKQKADVRRSIESGKFIEYKEGDINSYLYRIAVDGYKGF